MNPDTLARVMDIITGLLALIGRNCRPMLLRPRPRRGCSRRRVPLLPIPTPASSRYGSSFNWTELIRQPQSSQIKMPRMVIMCMTNANKTNRPRNRRSGPIHLSQRSSAQARRSPPVFRCTPTPSRIADATSRARVMIFHNISSYWPRAKYSA